MFPFHTIFNMHRASDSIAAADNVLVFLLPWAKGKHRNQFEEVSYRLSSSVECKVIK